MLFELWGATLAPRLALPERPLGYLLLLVYGALFLTAVYRQRRYFRQFDGSKWTLTAVLFGAALIFSQLFLIFISSDNQLSPLGATRNPVAVLVPFGAFPFLIAAVAIGPPAALVVGFGSGLGRALWQSHHMLDPLHFALAAYLAAVWLQQNYHGRVYQWLRQPVVSSTLAISALIPLVGLATFAYSDNSASSLAAFDVAASTATAHIVPLLLEGILSGILVTLLLIGLPQWQPGRRPTTPSPQQRSLNYRLLTSFGVYACALVSILLLVGFRQVVNTATGLVVNQMAHDARAVSAKIPDFLAHRQHLLVQFSQDPDLLSDDQSTQEQTLSRLFRTGDFYRRVALMTESDSIAAFYPNRAGESVPLTALEREAIADALETGESHLVAAHRAGEDGYVITLIVPVLDAGGTAQAVLLGHVPEISLENLIVGLQGTLGQGTGFIVDERWQVIAHPDSGRLMTTWTPPEVSRRAITMDTNVPGVAYEGRQGNTNARELVYYLAELAHPWTVVITVPYEVVLSMALQIGRQLTGVLVIGMLIFALNLLYLGRSITRPLNELLLASQRIAGGRLNTPIRSQGDDEVGQLARAFGRMQVSLKKRLDELSLLLAVSQDVSTSMDVNQGLPTILKGVLRATGAAGVRAVVLNPSGRQPVTFGEGPAARSMALFDRQIMGLLRQKGEITLGTPEQVQTCFELPDNREAPIKALMGLTLITNERFQGILWLGYRQPHSFDETEVNLLRTLASQASVLVENSRLFATAEGGRRRLAAVLASTSDAVIVTDQTERILLINPAMEDAFNLRAADVMNRPVAAVIKVERLVEALTSNSDRTRNLEIVAGNGKSLYASVSTILNNDSQVLGRVAVLHDISYLKEVDEMKSEFVATVSHDLRSPLTFMRGYATMMPMVGDLTPKQAEYVDKILAGIEQMSTLVDDLLDLGRLEAGIDLVLDKIHISELLSGIVVEHAQPAQTKGIHLTVLADRILPKVTGDVSLIRQAVTNLVSNAIKYAPDSGEVALCACTENGEMILSVRDNGPGIAKQDQLRLFEKFYRIQQRGKALVKGSGLGLSIVKTIAERHGGRAWVESEIGKGSTFYISLPLD
jgi:PAS domain S-box-containing protein